MAVRLIASPPSCTREDDGGEVAHRSVAVNVLAGLDMRIIGAQAVACGAQLELPRS